MREKRAKIFLHPLRNPMGEWETLDLFKIFPVGCVRLLGLLTPGGNLPINLIKRF